ncbi:MAG: hypothetical protein RLZZ555_534 [Pseudomonadota bacterium]|jgi:translocation and assembly module TamB
MRPLRAIASLASGLAWLAGTTVALLIGLLLSAWIWSGQADSLPRTLGWLQGWLRGPDGAPMLLVSDASGSLREGGRIGSLRWQQEDLLVELSEVELRWSSSLWPELLLRRELRLDALELQRMRVHDSRPSSPDRTPPAELRLPWLQSVRVPLRVSAVSVDAPVQLGFGPLQAEYRYGRQADGGFGHELQLGELRWAAGSYRLQARLQASAPLSLHAELQGELEAQAPGGRRQQLAASARLAGQLAGPDASLDLWLDASSRPATPSGASLRARATLLPWAELPLPTAELELHEIDLAAFWPQAPRTRLQGRWQAASRDGAATSWRLEGELRNQAAGPWQRGALPLKRLGAELSLAGSLWQLKSLDAELIEGGQLQARGSWQDGLIQLDQADLTLASAKARASGQLDWKHRQLSGQLAMTMPGAQASLDAGRTQGQARLGVDDAQRLQRWLQGDLVRWLQPSAFAAWTVGPLQAIALSGQASLESQWQGPLQVDRLPSDWQAALAIPSLQLQWPPGQSRQPLRLRDWSARLAAHGGRMAIGLDGQAMGASWQAGTRLEIGATLDPGQPGRGAELLVEAGKLDFSDALRSWTLDIARGAVLRWPGGDEITLTPGRATLALADRRRDPTVMPAEIAWDASSWKGGRLASRGRISSLALDWIDLLLAAAGERQGPLAQAGLGGNLTLESGWDIDLALQPAAPAAPASRARLEIRSSQGDLSLPLSDSRGSQPVGLEQARASLVLAGSSLKALLQWDSRLAGRLDAELGTELLPPAAGRPGWDWLANAPLSGRVQAALPRLDLWSRLAPPGWRIGGSVQADARLGGSRLKPEWHGKLRADELTLRSLLDGLDFSGGQLRASLEGEQVRLDSLQLRGAGGDQGGLLLGSGTLSWPRAEGQAGQAPLRPRLALELEARQLRLLARADRRLSLSGQLSAGTDGRLLDLGGKLRVDQALFVLPDEDRPVLGDDVKVRGQDQPERTAGVIRLPLRLQLDLALGEDFSLRGQGIDTRLAGELRLSASPEHPEPRLLGQVHTVRGRYRAWGQALEIEEGLLDFGGPYDNPGLDILALRPLSGQRVGVKVGGTALAPQVKLYSDPELPESEKLAWLVLGRPASGAGAEAALLQQAAIALLSGRGKSSDGRLQRGLGLDEISFRGETQKADGSSSAAALVLGKRISRELYLSYSRSVVGTSGTIAVLYDLTRQLTLRAKAGEDNALELVFTRQYDGRRAGSAASSAAPE